MIIRLLQWNCMYSEDVGAVANFVKSLDPDIVCLQELTNGYYEQWGDTGAYISSQLGFDGFYKYGLMMFPDGSQGYMGNGIFSRYRLDGRQMVAIEQGKVKDGRVLSNERYYLQAALGISGRRLTVATTHLPFHPRMVTTSAKRAMAEQILHEAARCGDYILAGDLNTTPYSAASKLLRRGGMKHAGPALGQPTWTTKPFTIGPWSYDDLRWRFDYVLYKGGVKRRRAEIVPTDLSDHLPILVEFELPD